MIGFLFVDHQPAGNGDYYLKAESQLVAKAGAGFTPTLDPAAVGRPDATAPDTASDAYKGAPGAVSSPQAIPALARVRTIEPTPSEESGQPAAPRKPSSRPGPSTSKRTVDIRPPATPYNFYVAPFGSDSNPGTVDEPFRTIQRGASAAVPNSTVHVAPGKYPGGFITSASGTSTERIYYVSDVKWGAKVVAPSNSTAAAIWANFGDYVTIHGFEVEGSDTNSTTFRDGIYSNGTRTVYEFNYVHDVGTRGPCIEKGGSGLNADHSKMGVEAGFYNNLIHHIGPVGCGTWFHGIYLSTSGKIMNNIIFGVPGGGIHMWHDATRVDVVNNTSVGNGFGIIVGSGGFYHKPAHPGDYINVYNNIIVDNHIQGISEQGITGPHNTYVNNLVYDNKKDWQHHNGTVDEGTINADPKFANPRTTTGDYRLGPNSPAIDRGDPTFAPSIDYYGNKRPRGKRHDIGAHEY